MEPFLADLINNNKIPKIIRYLIVTIPSFFCIWVGINVGLCSEMLLGNIFGFVFAVTMLTACIYIYIKIYKS